MSRAQPAKDAKSEFDRLVVSLDQPSDFLKWAKKSLEDSLAGIRAKKQVPPRSVVSALDRAVLWGDLFKTGGCFALLALSPPGDEKYGVAFAEWIDGKWELRGLWKIFTVWRPKGWKKSDDDYLPTTPAIRPFELRDLSGDGVPEVIVAGEVEKYFQENYLLRFSSKTHTLSLVAAAMRKPEVLGKFVRLYSNSGRRAIFEEWQFLKWQGDELIPVASWHDEVGYGTNDPTFAEGERLDQNGQSETIRVIYGKGVEIEADFYELEREGKPFGRMRVTWRDARNRISMNSDEIEKAWLFEKITGLPRQLYPAHEGNKNIPRLEGLVAVTIEGNTEAATLFSTAKKQR